MELTLRSLQKNFQANSFTAAEDSRVLRDFADAQTRRRIGVAS